VSSVPSREARGSADAPALPVPGVRRAAPWWSAPSAVAGAVVVGLGLLLARDPHVPGSWGACPSLLLTGLACPACGALRATADLLHGDLAAAWASNPLWVGLVPVLVVAWCLWALRRRAALASRLPPAVGVVGLVVLVGFGVLRNLPATGGALGP